MQLKQNKSKRAIEQNLRFSAQRTKHICNNEIEDILKKLKYLSFRDVGSILYVIPKDIQIQGVPKKSTFRMLLERVDLKSRAASGQKRPNRPTFAF